MSYDDLVSQARSLKTGLEEADNAITTRRQELERMEADRLAMKQRLGNLERFLDGEGVSLPYSDRRGIR